MRPSHWKLFPLAIIAGLGVVVLVNVGMVYAALHSFPGKAGDEDFALSNRYDAVLEREQREASLGWTVVARTDVGGVPEITLADRDGSPLRGAVVAATAERPLGAPERRALVFHEAEHGRYVADASLPEAGQWELTLSASFGGHDLAATRRVIVR
jgi:nitrogen fixation protein FixH